MTDDYRKQCIAVGIARNKLGVFPYKYLGMTDAEFMAQEIHFAHGPVVPDRSKRMLLGMVRIEEATVAALYVQYSLNRKRALAGLKPLNIRRQLRLF